MSTPTQSSLISKDRYNMKRGREGGKLERGRGGGEEKGIACRIKRSINVVNDDDAHAKSMLNL